MELDISSIWSWTLPLWGLIVIILFLVGVLTEPPDVDSYKGPQRGGVRQYKNSSKLE
jgi:hypothetical protein